MKISKKSRVHENNLVLLKSGAIDFVLNRSLEFERVEQQFDAAIVHVIANVLDGAIAHLMGGERMLGAEHAFAYRERAHQRHVGIGNERVKIGVVARLHHVQIGRISAGIVKDFDRFGKKFASHCERHFPRRPNRRLVFLRVDDRSADEFETVNAFLFRIFV